MCGENEGEVFFADLALKVAPEVTFDICKESHLQLGFEPGFQTVEVDEPYTAIAVTSRQQGVLNRPVIDPAETTERLLSIQFAADVFRIHFDLLGLLCHDRFLLQSSLNLLAVHLLVLWSKVRRCKLIHFSSRFLAFLLRFDAQLVPYLGTNRPGLFIADGF